MSVKKIEVFAVGAGAVVIAALIFAFAFPRPVPIDSLKNKISVVTTLFPLYDFARQVGGDRLDVTLLLPPGVEAHAFEPRPSDIVKINDADIFIYTGKIMEPWAADLAASLPVEVKVVDASKGVKLQAATGDHHHEGHEEEDVHAEGHADEETGNDPHIWLDFGNVDTIVTGIASAMAEKDPVNAEYYRANAEIYVNKIDGLDAEYRASLDNCLSRELVYGGHYAFGYLTHRYGLSYSAAQGVSPDSEPTIKDLSALVDQIRREKISYVFYEELSSPKIAETVAKETGAKMLLLNAAHNVSRDDIGRETTFIDIMKANLNNLKIGLECHEKT